MSKLDKLLYKLIGKQLLGQSQKVKVKNIKSGQYYEVLKTTAERGVKSGKYTIPGGSKQTQSEPTNKKKEQKKTITKPKHKKKKQEIKRDQIVKTKNNTTITSKMDIKSSKQNKISFQEVRKLDEKVYVPAYKTQQQHERVIAKKLQKLGVQRNKQYNLYSQCGFSQQQIKSIQSNLHSKTLLKTIQYVMSCMPLPQQEQEYYASGAKKKPRNDLQRLTDVLKLGQIANLKNAGQGRLASQVGQMITNLSIHLPEETLQKFHKTLLNHNINDRGTQQISWVQSAIGCGKASRQLVRQHFGQQYQIVPFSGMMQNKFVNQDLINTNDTKADIFMHVRNKQSGEAFMVPVSLKKDNKYRIDNTTLQRVMSVSEEATEMFSNDKFRQGRQQVYKKNQKHPLYSHKNIMNTIMQKIDSGEVDLESLNNRHTRQIYQLYNKTKDMSKQQRKQNLSSIEQAKSIYNDGRRSKKSYIDKKFYMMSLQVLGQIDQEADRMKQQVVAHSKEFCNDAIKYFMKEPDIVLEHVRRNFPLKQMYQQGLVQVSNQSYVTWQNILQNMNIKTVDTFIQNLGIQQSGDGSFRIVYSFKTQKGMQFIDMFNVQVRQDGIGYKTPRFDILPLPGFERVTSQNIGAINQMIQRLLYRLIGKELKGNKKDVKG